MTFVYYDIKTGGGTSFTLRGIDANDNATLLFTAGISDANFGWYGPTGITFYHGGVLQYYIENLANTYYFSSDGNPCLNPSDAITAIYSDLT